MSTSTIAVSSLRILSNLSGLAPIYFGRRIRNLIWYYCWASLTVDAACYVLKRLSMPCSWLGNLFFVLELSMVGMFLDRSVFKGTASLINRLAILSLLAYFVQDTLRTSILKANMEAVGIVYIYYIIVLLFAFAKIVREVEYTHIQKSPLFIFCAGFFVYACGVALIFLFERYLIVTDQALLNHLWIVHNFLNVTKHAFIASYFVLKQGKS